MPTTVNRGYQIPATGSDVNIWGSDDLNPNFAAIDSNLGGVANVALSNANVTLTQPQYVCGTIRFTGALTANVAVTFPAVQGWWTIDNQTTGAFVATLTTGSGQVIAVDQGAAADIFLDGANVKFRNLPPVGTYLDVCDAVVPAWIAACTVPPYLNCNGAAFSNTTYPYLAAKLGSTTLPDIRGGSRATLNQGTGRITTASSGIDGNTRFARGGSDSVTLNTNQIPSHVHNNTLNDPSHTHQYVTPGGPAPQSSGGIFNAVPTVSITNTAAAFTGVTITNDASGGGGSHSNMPPTTISGLTLIRAA